MSQNAHDAIMEYPEFITECRGDITVKVKKFFPVQLDTIWRETNRYK